MGGERENRLFIFWMWQIEGVSEDALRKKEGRILTQALCISCHH
jgi:hypothetical protein